MHTSKKPASATAHGKFRDLKAKKNPKGGLQKEVYTAVPNLYQSCVTGGSTGMPSLPINPSIVLNLTTLTGGGSSGGSGKG
jgi:hypothetical protein